MITKRYYINKTSNEPFRYHFEEYENVNGVWQDTLVGGWLCTINEAFETVGFDIEARVYGTECVVCTRTVIENNHFLFLAHIDFSIRAVIILEPIPQDIEWKIREFAATYQEHGFAPPVSPDIVVATYLLCPRPECDNAQKSF